MIKVHYPADIEKLRKEYLKIFDITAMKSQWASEEQRTGFKLEDLLTGDFDYLVDVFLWYKGQTITEGQNQIHKNIFNYEDKQPEIAEFFMNSNNGFNLSTCHYCNIAYINNYSKSLSYTDKLDFINKASFQEWREFFKPRSLDDQKLIDVMNGRPYKSLDVIVNGSFVKI